MANDYTTSTDVFDEIPEAGYSSTDFPAIASYCTVASRLIDRTLGKPDGYFYPTTDGVTMYYDGSGTERQEIDGFASITSVAVSEQGGLESSDYTTWSSSDYITYPLNAANKGLPITHLLIDVQNGSKSVWYSYPKSVQIVGIMGISTTLSDVIKKAATVQAARWFMRAKQGWQDNSFAVELGSLKFTGGAQKLDADIALMLEPWVLEASLD